MTKPLLTLYNRHYCHLCQDMLQRLRQLQQDQAFELEIVEIDDNPEWVRQFGEWVPVLKRGDKEICHYFLDEEALKACLAPD